MILWKMAGEVLAKPSLFEVKWNCVEIVDQLKYRYVPYPGQSVLMWMEV